MILTKEDIRALNLAPNASMGEISRAIFKHYAVTVSDEILKRIQRDLKRGLMS